MWHWVKALRFRAVSDGKMGYEFVDLGTVRRKSATGMGREW